MQQLLWLHADPIEALGFQALRCLASLYMVALWARSEDRSIAPALVCGGWWAREGLVVGLDRAGRASPVEDAQAFFARQRRHMARFPLAGLIGECLDDDLDLAAGRLIDRSNKPLIVKAMKYWTLGEEFQLPFLRAMLPGLAFEMPPPDDSLLGDLELI